LGLTASSGGTPGRATPSNGLQSVDGGRDQRGLWDWVVAIETARVNWRELDPPLSSTLSARSRAKLCNSSRAGISGRTSPASWPRACWWCPCADWIARLRSATYRHSVPSSLDSSSSKYARTIEDDGRRVEESEDLDWSSWGTVASRATFQQELVLAGDEQVRSGRGAALSSDAGMRVRREPEPTWPPDLLSFDSSSSKYVRTTRDVADEQAGDEHAMVRGESPRTSEGRGARQETREEICTLLLSHGRDNDLSSFFNMRGTVHLLRC